MVWVLGTVLSTGVAYAAVQMVSGSVVASQREPVTSTTTVSRGPGTSPPATPPLSPSPHATPSAVPVAVPTSAPPFRAPTPPPAQQPASSTRTFALVGGTAQLTCGNGIVLDWATPNSGFWVETSTEGGGTTIEVRFRSDSHESRLDAWCSGGTIQFTVREESS